MEGENVKKVFKLTDAFYSLLLLLIPFFFVLWMLGIFKQPFSVHWAFLFTIIYLIALSSKYWKVRNLEKCFYSLGDKADKENTEIKNKYENLKDEHEKLNNEYENLKYENTQLKENEKEKIDRLLSVLSLIKQSLEFIVKRQSQILEDPELSREHLVKEEQKATTDEAIEENIAEISDSDEMQSLAKTIPDNEERNDSGIQTEAETTKEEEVPVSYPKEGSGKPINIELKNLEDDDLLWKQGMFYGLDGSGPFEIIENLEKIYIYPRRLKTGGEFSSSKCDDFGYKKLFNIEPKADDQIKITKIIPAEVKIVGQDKIILLNKGKIITSENG